MKDKIFSFAKNTLIPDRTRMTNYLISPIHVNYKNFIFVTY